MRAPLDPAAEPVTADLRRARTATALAFGAQGLVFISLTTRLPVLQDRWDLGEATLSVLLLMMVLLAGVGSVVAEQLARNRHSAGVLRVGLLVVAVSVPVLVGAPELLVFVAGLAAYGVGLGLVDAAGNMQAVAVEHRYGRPILPSFHGAWTLGGLIGATLTLIQPDLWVAGVTCVVPLVVALAAPFLPRVGEPDTAGITVPWRPIVLVGLGMVLFYMVDTAATTWGPTYLDNTFPTPDRWVALATFPYLLATLVMRFAGDGLVARFGPVRVLRAGGVLAFLSLLVVVTAPAWPVAVLGFTLLGLGVAVIAPLSFSAAARIAGGDDVPAAVRQARVDVVIGRFNQFNYVGALLGAVLTGLVGANSLRVGFAVPMVLILGILPLARHFGGRSDSLVNR
ncbi:MFS transporter [Nocardioides guangzhouensis]|uniref:MFS transporter n=1 Tax=Nocardioides guangzhouensis TaxID=2497878 RepID=A0A4Q4Z2Y4_9ACTN|nr:MFS transporter [Nocardioides guangzhouensis]RYP81184.1 MFS transporter [Nocardioides guangzhouensis]